MKRIFWGGLLLFLLVGCGGSGPEAKVRNTFVLSVDPSVQTVEVLADGAVTVNQETGERVLVPGQDLVVEAAKFAFLPGNILRLELTFKNVSRCTFSELNFSRGADSRAVVDSAEPEVSSADLGGDGMLVPGEVTDPLQFGVTHMGKPFTYEIEAEALVTCGAGPRADLRVDITERFGDPVARGENVEYYVNVRNSGPEPATGVKLTVGFPFTLPSMPEGCIANGNGGLTCTVSDIPVEESRGVTIRGMASEEGTFTVTAQASANEADPDSNNNSDSEKTVVILPEVICTDPVSIPDVALEKAIRAELQKSKGDPLTCSDLENLTELSSNFGSGDEDDLEPIRSLKGLEFAENLTTLTLNGNNISNLGPLSGLTRLETLSLYSNNVVDLAPLAGLTSLTSLQLGVNSISDVSPLRNLSNLSLLELDFNKIESISALVANEGLGNGNDFIDLSGNCLNAEARSDAATIENRNPNFKNVKYDPEGDEQCGP